MFSNNFLLYTGQIILELLRDIIYFPIWWYSRGLVNLLLGVKNFLSDKQKSLALLVWLKNIFRPMYAQDDFAGTMISFFVRLIQIIFRSFLMLFWLAACLVVIIGWLILPILVVYEIIFQFI